MDVLGTIRSDRVVAVVRATTVHDPAAVADAFAHSGIRCVEFTFTIDGVLEAISAAAETDAVVGAGTVTSVGQAREAVDAGAAFVVSPVLLPELVDAVDVPVFLAGFSPSEVHQAVEAGAAAVKLFPARVGGPAYVSDLLGPLADAALIPSGGIDAGNARDFLDAGAIAVYAGSGLAPPDAVESGDHDELQRRAETFVAAL